MNKQHEHHVVLVSSVCEQCRAVVRHMVIKRISQQMKCRTRTRRALGGAHVPPTKLLPRLAANKTIVKPRVTAATVAHGHASDSFTIMVLYKFTYLLTYLTAIRGIFRT